MKIRSFILLSTLLLSLSLSAQGLSVDPTMHSTSTMLNERNTNVQQAHSNAVGFSAISTVPTIGSNGQAVLPDMATATYSNDEETPDNPFVDPDTDKPNGMPVGDAVLPLLSFLLIYTIVRSRKNHTTAE